MLPITSLDPFHSLAGVPGAICLAFASGSHSHAHPVAPAPFNAGRKVALKFGREVAASRRALVAAKGFEKIQLPISVSLHADHLGLGKFRDVRKCFGEIRNV